MHIAILFDHYIERAIWPLNLIINIAVDLLMIPYHHRFPKPSEVTKSPS